LAPAAIYPAAQAHRLTRRLSRAWTSKASRGENLIERLREHQVNNARCGSSFVAVVRWRHDDSAELALRPWRRGTPRDSDQHERARLIGHEIQPMNDSTVATERWSEGVRGRKYHLPWPNTSSLAKGASRVP
jgi:hypothetical protein